MSPDSVSGIYKCTSCNNEETHVKGNSFAPCSQCGSNSSWKLVRETK